MIRCGQRGKEMGSRVAPRLQREPLHGQWCHVLRSGLLDLWAECFPVSGILIKTHPQSTHSKTRSDSPLFLLILANSYSFFKTSARELAPQGSLITASPTQRHTGWEYVPFLTIPSTKRSCLYTHNNVLSWLVCLSVSSIRPWGQQALWLIHHRFSGSRAVSAHGPQQIFL